VRLPNAANNACPFSRLQIFDTGVPFSRDAPRQLPIMRSDKTGTAHMTLLRTYTLHT